MLQETPMLVPTVLPPACLPLRAAQNTCTCVHDLHTSLSLPGPLILALDFMASFDGAQDPSMRAPLASITHMPHMLHMHACMHRCICSPCHTPHLVPQGLDHGASYRSRAQHPMHVAWWDYVGGKYNGQVREAKAGHRAGALHALCGHAWRTALVQAW